MGQVLEPIASPLGITVKCGSSPCSADESPAFDSCVNAAAKGATVPMNDTGFKLVVAGAVAAFTAGFELGAYELASQMTLNQVKALNSAKCAVDNLGDNTWNFLAAIYYAARQFGQADALASKINEYYPVVYTCQLEIMSIVEAANALKTDLTT